MSNLDSIKEKLSKILGVNKDIIDELVYAFVLEKLSSFLGFYHSLFLEEEDLKKESIMLKRKIKAKIEKHTILDKIDINFGKYIIRITPSKNRDRIYIYLVKDRRRYGPIGEVIAKENGLDIFVYNNKIANLREIVNEEELRKDLERLKFMEEFNQIERLNSKVRTIYEISQSYKDISNNIAKKEKKVEKSIQKKNLLELAIKADKELMKKFGDKEIVTREEIEEILKKYGLTFDEFITIASLNTLEFPSSFYEAEPGKFKKI